MSSLPDITGLWRRSLIRWPDGRTDTTTAVRWMQGPSLFVDLRQPAERPDFSRVRCLRDLSRFDLSWLARQEGFAGEIHFDGRYYEWRRQIDLQPASATADAGRLWFEGELMLEEGRDIPYIEHWQRQVPVAAPCGAIALQELGSGLRGFIVRVADCFMYARDRAVQPMNGASLLQRVHAAAPVQQAQDLIDCEISAGRIGSQGWRIEHSSLPFKEGQILGPRSASQDTAGLQSNDLAPDGAPILRHWAITRIEGALRELLGRATSGR